MKTHRVFVTGATGYIGSRLIPVLAARGHEITALTREESQHKLPRDCRAVRGNALDGESYAAAVEGADTFIHLVGVSHPSPAKARQFVEIDLKSAGEAICVARAVGIRHFIYLSVAHPAPVMHAYIQSRSAGEQLLRASELNATILRPWYVLGPGHLALCSDAVLCRRAARARGPRCRTAPGAGDVAPDAMCDRSGCRRSTRRCANTRSSADSPPVE
jgi:uncharacterized protein YbjT (DUF2867 family)